MATVVDSDDVTDGGQRVVDPEPVQIRRRRPAVKQNDRRSTGAPLGLAHEHFPPPRDVDDPTRRQGRSRVPRLETASESPDSRHLLAHCVPLAVPLDHDQGLFPVGGSEEPRP